MHQFVKFLIFLLNVDCKMRCCQMIHYWWCKPCIQIKRLVVFVRKESLFRIRQKYLIFDSFNQWFTKKYQNSNCLISHLSCKLIPATRYLKPETCNQTLICIQIIATKYLKEDTCPLHQDTCHLKLAARLLTPDTCNHLLATK